MKKIFFVLLIIVISSSAFAQDSTKQQTKQPQPQQQPPQQSQSLGMHFGFKFAPDLGWFKTDSPGLSSDGSKFGFTYGVITEFNFAKNYAFATGIDVTYRGGKFKSVTTDTASGITTSMSSSYNLEFIEIPLTLKLKTNEIGDFTYFIQFGVAPGFNIRARKDYSGTTQDKNGVSTAIPEATKVDAQSEINTFNLSMIIAPGLEYKLSGTTVLLAGITFNNGFLDMFDSDKVKSNNNFLALTLGILF